MTEKELRAIVHGLLIEGTPTGVVSRVLHLDEDLIKQHQKIVRVERYGTADMEEYKEQLQWDALEFARVTLAKGKPAEQARVMSTLLGKSMAGTRVPDSVKEARAELDQVAEDMKTGEPEERPRSRFVAIRGGDGA